MSKATVLQCEAVSKIYAEGVSELRILDAVSLKVDAGERVAIIGSSGSGKSTLLNILGGLDRCTSGSVKVMGQPVERLSENQRAQLRNRHLGFVYQFHHLLGEFSALENVAMPLLLSGVALPEIRERAREVLVQVGLEQRIKHKPAELSGGERQRVAIARALVARPDCVLMDEPTGNLDRQTAGSIQDLMLELNRTLDTAFVVVTHDHQLAERMDRVILLEDGILCEQPVGI
jgi:lipoprotein-releasing system ATP-binding protein